MHRKIYLKDVELGIVTMRWREENGMYVKAGENTIPLAAGSALEAGEVWYDGAFGRIPGVSNLPVTVIVKKGREERPILVEIPNLHQDRLQQIGVKLVEGTWAVLMLRNGLGQTESQPFLL